MTDPVAAPAPRVVDTTVLVNLTEAAGVVAVDVIVPAQPPVSLEVLGNGTATLRVPIRFHLHYKEPAGG